MNWDHSYDRFLGASAWLNALLYAGPSALLLAACWYWAVDDRLWVPLLLVYVVGAVAHLLGYGFMAVGVQIKNSTDYSVAELRKTLQSVSKPPR